MLEHLDELKEYKKFWYITIAVFDTDLELNVPSIDNVINDFIFLSKKLDKSSFNWRYTPIIINNKYTIEKHIETFEYMWKASCVLKIT